MMIVSLFHFGRLGSAPALVYQFWFCLDLLNSVHATFLITIRMEIIYRHVKLNQLFYRFMTGLFISWVHYLVLWVTEFGQLTHTRRSDGGPDLDGALKAVVRIKIRHYRQLYLIRFDFAEIIGHEDFYTARSFLTAFYYDTTDTFHLFFSS
jgi:hypothetical protein